MLQDLGGGLQLHRLDESNAQELFDLTDRNRDYLRQWLPWLDGTRTVADTREFLSQARREEERGSTVTLGIWVDDRLIGTAAMRLDDDPDACAQIGYWLSADLQGKGVMTRTVRALVDDAFKHRRRRCIEIHCAPGNLRSRAIPERLGFAVARVLPRVEWLYDHFEDHIVYEMTSEEWTKRSTVHP